MRLLQILSSTILLAATLTAAPSWAYNEVLSTGQVLERGQFRLTGGLQALTERGGANVTGIIDTGIQEDFEVRGILGFGKTDYLLGALVQWVPIPDVEGQPAVGFLTGITYARWFNGSEFTLQWNPLVSKKFAVGEGAIIPYAGIPLGLRFRDNQTVGVADTTQMTIQVTGGAQIQVERWKNLQFIGEVGINLEHAYSYVSAGALFYFDTEYCFKLE